MRSAAPEFYSHVLLFGPGNRDVDPDGAPAVRVGGVLLGPRVAFSYLLAARRLITQAHGSGDRLDVVAFPVAYVQRHAFEVALKDLIAMAYDVEHSRKWLQQLERRGADAVLPSRRKMSKEHAFKQLINALREALKVIDHSPGRLPNTLDDTAQRLADAEQRDEHRFRYGTFEKPVVLELGAMQEELEALFDRHLWFRDWDHAEEQDSTFADLAMELEGLFQRTAPLEQRLGITRPADAEDWF